MTLTGRTALVTGSARGLGLAIARTLVEQGARVVMTDVDERAVKESASGLPGAIAIPLDVGDREETRAVIGRVSDEFSGLDILVNNAGFQRIAPIGDFDEDQWSAIITTMLTGTFLCTKYALPHLRRSRAGRVINIASVHGLVASPNKSAYIAAKHGIVGFTKCLAIEEARNGVTANAVCPGYIRTPLAEAQVAELARTGGVPESQALEEILLEPVPLKRMLEPTEVAAFVAYLASDVAGGITGSALPIDGGWTAH